ncbi:hypothetical protein TM1040_0802 [Ruegeria sp. TM1040]|uniref:DUF4055 domain-containing protein n=1 Tax=Ruegeria sp. (strain TM1040) TaxID=292414 RepID=UPI0000462672|nr:DUF4055 domain-containing protein [Ruegeria sp. TM1040]ABF63535.1 hypothetical protein TM1040_0802 [Ruegeria sp. TM1040]
MTQSVAQRTPAAEALVKSAALGRILMGGTKAMRGAGQKHLPKFPAESHEAYEARLASSFLFNGFKKTVRDMTGRVFTKSVEIESDTLKEEEQNIDMQGRDLSAFARDVFEAGLSGCGLSFIMVDAPPRQGDVTKAQAQASNLRPYLVHVKVEEVLGWKTATEGSRTFLSQWRMMETLELDDPEDEFSVASMKQVRVLTLVEGRVNVRLYREADKGANWELHAEFDTQATEITVVPFYANRTGFFAAEPPLEDLADKNVEHWQSASDQRNILHFARVPILFASGRDDESPLTFSASAATTARDPNAKLEWVEHSGAAIGAGRDDLKDLEFQMQVLGLQLLVAGTETATGASLDAAKETAPLAMMADNLKDSLEQALRWFTMYQGSENAVTVKVNKDFGVSMLTAQELTVMLTAVNTGNMPRRVFVEEMKRRGFIAEDTDTDAYLGDLDDETPPGLTDGGE